MLDKPASSPRVVADTAGPPLDFQEHLARLEAAGLLVRIDRPIDKDTELHPLTRWQFTGGLPRSSGAPSCSPTWSIQPAANTTSRSWSARWPPRRRSIPSAWAVRWARSARPGWTPSTSRSRRCRSPARRARRSSSPATRCAPDGLKRLPVPVSTPGFDAAPYLTATLCVTKDPETGIQNMGTYRAALKATDRLGVRMSSRVGGAGGYQHWRKYHARRRADAGRDRHRRSARGRLHRAAEARARLRRDGGRRRPCRRSHRDGQVRHRAICRFPRMPRSSSRGWSIPTCWSRKARSAKATGMWRWKTSTCRCRSRRSRTRRSRYSSRSSAR